MSKKRKTKSELEAEADALMARLPSPSERSLIEKAFGSDAIVWWHRDKRRKPGEVVCHCTRCGGDFVDLEEQGVPLRCPRCGMKADVRERDDTNGAGVSFFDVRENLVTFDALGGWQFVRWWNCRSRGSTTKGKAEMSASLLIAFCFPPDPRLPVMMKRKTLTNCYSCGVNRWDIKADSPMRWKGPEGRFEFEWKLMGKPTFSRQFRWFVPREGIGEYLIEYMGAVRRRHNPMLETVYNLGMFEMARHFVPGGSRPHRIGEYAPMIRMAIRHKWAVGGEWLDAIDEVIRDGRANVLRSDKWMEPTALARIEQRVRDAERKKEREERERRMLKDAEKCERAYAEAHRRELRGSAVVGPYEIRPLLTIREFLEEGIAMNHCVFSNYYYKKDYSVILTVRSASDGKRVETCEWDKRKNDIRQLYGANDSTPPCQLAVAAAVRKAMPYILRGQRKEIRP